MVAKSSNLLAVSEVALKLDISEQAVRKAINSKRLRARKIGWSWVIEEKDLPRQWSDLFA